MADRLTPEQFRTTRATLGLSTSQLAEYLADATGRTQRADTLRKWETGKTLIPHAMADELALVAERRATEIAALQDEIKGWPRPPR